MSDDLIKRSDAIKAVWSPQVRPDALIFDALKRAIESVINNIPSAQAEWVDSDGNFVPLDENGFSTAEARCSHCGDWLTASDEYSARGRFCPNCGYRMKGADNE